MYTIIKLVDESGPKDLSRSVYPNSSSDGIPEQLKCPICFEVPPAEIYQCVRGHIICSSCQASIRNCPLCRLPFEVGGELIRVRALESFLDLVALPCPHQNGGCQESVSRLDVKTHVKNCIFNGKCVQLCKQFGHSCDFWTNGLNTNNAVDHFRTEHKAEGPILLEKYDCVEIHIKNLRTAVKALEGDGVWTPVILSRKQDHFMVLTLFNEVDNSVSWLCLELRCDWHGVLPSVGKNEVEFFLPSIKSGGMPAMKWKVPTVSILYSSEIIQCPGNRMPLSLLEKYHLDSRDTLKVKVAIVPMSTHSSIGDSPNIDEKKLAIIAIGNITTRNRNPRKEVVGVDKSPSAWPRLN